MSNDEMVQVPRAALAWLFGEAADADGKWLGDDEDAEIRTPRKYSHKYWWRSKFRSMIPALSNKYEPPAVLKPGDPGYSFRDIYNRVCREIADRDNQ